MQQQYDQQTISRLRKELERKREEILAWRKQAATSREQLGQRESEPEAQAQAETRAQELHSQDEHTRQEIWEIDAAFTRMDLGAYGLCTGCGEHIDASRIEAVPWTRYCMGCMEQGIERSSKRAQEDIGHSPESSLPSAQPAPLPEEFQGMGEQTLRNALLERLAQDDRLDMAEVAPRLEDGVLVLEGAVASESDRQLLLQILHDTLGFTDLRDRLRVEPLLFERGNGRPTAPENVPRTEEQELLEGESADNDIQQAREEGGSITPPDRFRDPREH